MLSSRSLQALLQLQQAPADYSLLCGRYELSNLSIDISRMIFSEKGRMLTEMDRIFV